MKFLSKLKIVSFFLLGLLFTLFTLTTQVNAQSNITQLPFYWESINVAIDVQDNGDMLVTETQKYVFNKEYSNQRYRYIPLDKVDKITDVSVSENNQILPSQVGKKNNQLWIKWQHELNPPESHTFELKYRVVGRIQVNSNDSQVHWEAIFSDRIAPIQNARVTVKLPKSLAGKINSYTYSGLLPPVSSQKLDEQTVEFIAQKPIPPQQELKVKIAFPNGVLDRQKPLWKQWKVIKKIIISIVLFLLSLFIFTLFLLLINSTSSNSGSSRAGSGHGYSAGGYSGGSSGGSGGDSGGG